MRIWFAIITVIFCWTAQAQFSVQESDGNNRLRIFGKEFSPGFYSLATTETDKMSSDGGRLSTYNYLTLRTWASNSFRPLIRLPFQYNTAGTDRFNGSKNNEQEVFLQDIILGMQKYDLMFVPFDIGVYWEGRVYLPTSKNSKQAGLITRLRNHFILSKALSRYFEIEYDNKFSYYFQSRSTYKNTFRDEFDFEQTVVSSTKQIELTQRFGIWGKVTPTFGLGWQVTSEDEYWNKSEAENKSKPGLRTFKTGPQMRFPIGNSINFIFAYEDMTTRQNTQQLGKFYAENTQFMLHSFIRF